MPVTERIHGSSVPAKFKVFAGTYTLGKLLLAHPSNPFNAPGWLSFVSITPSPTQAVKLGETITFVLNFTSVAPITVYATVDGRPWGGPVNYTVTGISGNRGILIDGSSVPQGFFTDLYGTYTVNYKSGGPIVSTLENITPAATQQLVAGGKIIFTLNFKGGLYIPPTPLPRQPRIPGGPRLPDR